jgi:PAS domain S-box-containing protein
LARQPQDLERSGIHAGELTDFSIRKSPGAGDPAARWALIRRLDQKIQESADLDKILASAVEELGSHLGLDRCALVKVNSAGESLSPAYQYCARGIQPVPDEMPMARVHGLDRFITRRGELILDDAGSHPQTKAIYEEEFSELGTRSLVCLPVCVEGSVKAVLTLAAVNRSRRWDEEEILLGRAVADRVRIAIKQAELVRQLRDSAREAEALYRASSLLVDAVGVEQMYEQILDAIADVFGHPDSTIWLLDDEAREAVATCTRGEVGPPPRRLSLDGPGLIPLAIRTRDVVNCRDVSQDPHYVPGLRFTRSELVVPLKLGESVIGVFNLESKKPGAFTERDERILTSFAARAARAVERERLNKQAQEAAARERLVSNITSLLNQSLDAESIFQRLVEELGRHLDVNRCVMARVDESNGLVHITHQYLSESAPAPGELQLSWYQPINKALADGAVISNDVVNDPLMEPVRAAFRESKTRGFLAVPIAESGPTRFLIACTTAEPRDWRAEEVELVCSLAGQAAIARERAELFAEVNKGKIEWERTFNAMPEAVFVFDRKRELTRANTEAAAMLGVESARMAGRTCCDVLKLATGLRDCLVDQAIETGEAVVREVMPPRISRPVLFTAEPVGEPGSESIGAIVVGRDLGDIRQAEAEAAKQKEFLSRLLEIAHDAVFVVDQTGRITWSNQRLSEISGYRADELRAIPLPGLITATSGPARVPARRRGRVPESFDAQLKCKDGSRRYVLATSTPIQEAGTVTGTLGMLHDITEIRTAAERIAQAEKLRALGQLAGGVAHNFNNLLAAILGHVQILKRAALRIPGAERLDIIERAAMDGAAVVRRINRFSLQASDEEFEPVDLAQIVKDSLDITRTRWEDDARSRAIAYTIDFRPSPTPLVSGRASELREVFVNIILNALDAMEPRGGRLLVNTGATAAGAFARVSDEGIGMSEDVRKRVFEPFFTTKGVGGTGLGLSASYAIIEQHGGRIEVESDEGQGSAFTVWFPLGQATGAEDGEDEQTRIEPARILVVDDDEHVRDALSEILEAYGHKADRAASGYEALELLRSDENVYSVAFVDLSMPDMDGLAVARLIKSLPDSDRRRMKVLLITGYGDAVLNEEETGLVDAVIPKPFHQSAIQAALEKALLRR